jgi:ABC-type amino acid transport substrate-binding protein
MTLAKAVALAAALALALPVHAQQARPGETAEIAAVRAAIAGDKKAYVASTLALTEAEAKRFWPIYDNYQRQLATTVRRTSRVVEEVVGIDRAMNDTHAKRLLQELTAIDDEEAKDRRRMHNQVVKALPPVKALRYAQIEHKARAIRTYDIAGAMPLVNR